MRLQNLIYIVENLAEWPTGSEIVVGSDGFIFLKDEYDFMKSILSPQNKIKEMEIASDGFIETQTKDNNIEIKKVIQAIIQGKKFQVYDSEWVDTTYDKVCELFGAGHISLIRIKLESPVTVPLSTSTLYYIPTFNSSGFIARKWENSKEDVYCLTNRWVFMTSDGAQNLSNKMKEIYNAECCRAK